ncbi:hypothetical protein ACP70R_033577 [Stipagrostis hirtigluma subsp. patula]
MEIEKNQTDAVQGNGSIHELGKGEEKADIYQGKIEGKCIG